MMALRHSFAVVCALVLAGCFAGYSEDSPHGARELRVRRGAFANDLVLTGELEAAKGDVVTVPSLPQWQTSIKWLIADGIEVHSGDRVAELDNGAFASNLDDKRQAVTQAARELQQKESEWSATVAEKALDVDKKRIDFDKTKLDAAIPAEIVSARDYEDRQVKYKRATVELAKAQEVLRSERASIAADRANLQLTLQKAERELHSAEQALEALVLRAPRDGIVVVADHPWEGRKLKDGDPAWVGLRLAQLPELSSLRVSAALADVDDGRVAVGMPVTMTLDAYPQLQFTGRVTDISAVAQESTRGSLRRAFRVFIRLDRVDAERMRPGLSSRIVVHRGASSSALLAPRAGIDFSQKQPAATLAGGKRVPVNLGACNAHDCVVNSGLREGDLLISGVPHV